MVLELDISLIDMIKPLTINQLVFLNLVLDVNQKASSTSRNSSVW